jgi:hypothetical protein
MSKPVAAATKVLILSAKEICDVTQNDVVIFDNDVAGVGGVRQSDSSTHRCADSRSTGATYVGTHESPADSQCADNKHTGGFFLHRSQSESDPDQHHGLALFVAG